MLLSSRFFVSVALALPSLTLQIRAQTFRFNVQSEQLVFPANIEGKIYQLETMLYRPETTERRPLVIFSHGRDGPASPRDPNIVKNYPQICHSLASRGYVVAYIVRRGYGNSDGPDSELRDTAVSSGLEAAKDYQAALQYWTAQHFVLPEKVVLMGQSQGGWSVLACTNVEMPGVLGVVNISGGTNYRGMGGWSSVYAHWVASSSELGRKARVSSFWIYSENDRSIPGATARKMFEAFSASGGKASLLMLPPYLDNGHKIVGAPGLFLVELDAYFASIGFSTIPAHAPAITAISTPNSAIKGGTVVLTAEVSGTPTPILQWRKNGVVLNESNRFSGVDRATLTISGIQDGDEGSYSLVAQNSSGFVFSNEVVLTIADTPAQVPIPNGHAETRIINLSTRGIVATGENVLIAGFIVSGSAPKKLLIVATGLNLARRFGIVGEIGRPSISIHQSIEGRNVKIAENNDWQLNAGDVSQTMTQMGLQLLLPSSDPARGDAALVITVAPGAYTAVVAPDAKSANQDGIGLIEVYDASPHSNSHLINISSRGLVETGGRQMIVGVITSGPEPSRLLIRAGGPGLRRFGVAGSLKNPVQSLYSHIPNTPALAFNDDWWLSAQSQQLAALMPQLGAFAFDPNSSDSALLVLLNPGAYTSIISSKDNVSGVVLAEIYDANAL